MNEEAEERIQAALKEVDQYYEEIVTEMQLARASALNEGIDYRFDEKLLGRFVGAIEWLAEASANRRKR